MRYDRIIKAAALVLSAVVAISMFTGCTGNTDPTDNTYEVTWQDAKCRTLDGFEFTFDGGVSAEEFVKNKGSHLESIEYMGFTMLQLKCNDGAYFKQNVEPVLVEKGYTTSVLDSRITDMIKTRPSTDVIYSTVKNIVDEYKDCTTLTTWDIADGLFESDFDVVGVIVDAFRKHDPNRMTNINLLPNYMFGGLYGEKGGNEVYEAYVSKFMETVRPSYISVYHYDVMFSWYGADGTPSTYSVIDRGDETLSRINNYEIIRKYAGKYDTDVRLVLQFTDIDAVARLDSRRMRYILNLAVAYGAKQLCIFAYYDGGATDHTSCVGENGNIVEKSELLNEAKDDLFALMSELKSKKTEKIFHFNPDSFNTYATKYTPYGVLANATVNVEEKDANKSMITFYTDGTFLITDTKMWYAPQKTSMRYSKVEISGVTLEAYDAEKGIWVAAENIKAVSLKNNTYTVKTETSDNILLRVAANG